MYLNERSQMDLVTMGRLTLTLDVFKFYYINHTSR